MRLLIMVLSCTEPPYIEMRKVQQETWDSVSVNGVDTVYYIGGGCPNGGDHEFVQIYPYSRELYMNVYDDYWRMQFKLKTALQIINFRDYDLVFKTNNSSYINKKLLLEFAEKLPREKCYCGIDGVTFASGCGVFLSHDCLDMLIGIYDEYPVASEDALTGSYLSQRGVRVTYGAQRIDLIHPSNYYQMSTPCYHYRCKNDHDRGQDLILMRKLFELYGKPTEVKPNT